MSFFGIDLECCAHRKKDEATQPLHPLHKKEEKQRSSERNRKGSLSSEKSRASIDKEMDLWDKWVDVESPDAFSFLQLAEDGGFSEVKGLYTASRWATASILIIFVVYNVYSVVEQDLAFMLTPVEAAAALGASRDVIDMFYFTEGIITAVAPTSGLLSVQVLGFLELCGLMYYVIELLLCTFRALTAQGFKKWLAIYTIFWSTLPALSVFSAMKLLYNIVPTVLISRAGVLVGQVVEAKAEGKQLKPAIMQIVIWFMFALVLGGLIGFDTFLMKLRIVSAKADTTKFTFTFVAGNVQFLIQLMAIVQLGDFVRERLFRFIFGGEDAVLQDQEVVLMETWNALLAKRMYRDFSTPQFIAVMSSFSDEDFQSLVLNEDAIEKSKV